jgi:hypothetical protein
MLWMHGTEDTVVDPNNGEGRWSDHFVYERPMDDAGTVPVFWPKITLEDAIELHAFAPFEARPGVRPMAFLSGVHYLLLVHTVNAEGRVAASFGCDETAVNVRCSLGLKRNVHSIHDVAGVEALTYF